MSNTSDLHLPQGIPVQAPNPNSGKIYRAFIGWPPNLPGYPRTMTHEPDRPHRDVSEEAQRMPMSDEELEAALRRADKATMGPWVARLTGTMGDVIADYEDNAMIEEITPNIDAHDAAFIAHARDDVPALVAEVRRLRARVDLLERSGDALNKALLRTQGCES